MTIRDALHNAHGIPAGEAELLLGFILHKNKAFLFAHEDYHLSPITYVQFRYFVWKRRRGIPIAYITHHKEFYGIDFYVNRHTLIPRPETEMMVEAVVDEFKILDFRFQISKTVIIDVGTGSGCIPIAIAAGIRKSGLSGYLDKIFATDISQEALKVAAKNARTQNVSIEFLHGNLLAPAISQILNQKSQIENIIITANLPYLTQSQFDREPSIQHEPRSALVAENNGLALYEHLLAQIANLISKILNLKFAIFIEIDPSQSTLVQTLVQQHFPGAVVSIKPDLAGHDRLVHIWLDKSEKLA